MLNMNAYIEGEHMLLIDIFLCMDKFKGVCLIHLISVLSSSKGEIVEPFFNFDNPKTLLL